MKIVKAVIIPRKIRINTNGQGLLRSVSITCCCAPAEAFHFISAADRVSLRRMRLHFLRSLMGIKRSQVVKNCVGDLLYDVTVQHLLFKFLFRCTAGKPLLHCFIQARSLFHCLTKTLVGAWMSGLCMCVCKGMFEH